MKNTTEEKEMDSTEIKQEISRLKNVLENQERAQTDPIQKHLNKARTLTPMNTRVTQPAFEEFLQAFEKLFGELKKKGII